MNAGLKTPTGLAAAPNGQRRWCEELQPGDLLDGRFFVTETIARGGMAAIHKAEDRQNRNQVVVLKVPFLKLELDPNFFNRFQREEEIGVRLHHPYLLKFHPVPAAKSRPYLVTEYLHGRTLFEMMADFHIFPEKDALAIASLVCEALAYLHARGIMHRDLKPDNIMLCFDGTIRLMDFGISVAGDSRRLTFTGFAPGTPHYMAPERVERKRGDARTDVYGLGAILYEMLTGQIAFDHENPLVIMNSRVTGDPVAPRALNPKLSPQTEEIVLRAMDRDPRGRYPTALDFKRDLDAPESVRVTGRAARLQASTPWKRAKRLAWKIFLFGVLPVMVQVALFFFLRYHFTKR